MQKQPWLFKWEILSPFLGENKLRCFLMLCKKNFNKHSLFHVLKFGFTGYAFLSKNVEVASNMSVYPFPLDLRLRALFWKIFVSHIFPGYGLQLVDYVSCEIIYSSNFFALTSTFFFFFVVLFFSLSAHGETNQLLLEQAQTPFPHQLLDPCQVFQLLTFWLMNGSLQWARWVASTPSCIHKVNMPWNKHLWEWVLLGQARPYTMVDSKMLLLHSSLCTIIETKRINCTLLIHCCRMILFYLKFFFFSFET